MKAVIWFVFVMVVVGVGVVVVVDVADVLMMATVRHAAWLVAGAGTDDEELQ